MAWIEIRRVCGVGALSILLAATVPGQAETSKPELPRGKALGEVRDKDRKPWVGVKVLLVSWPVPDNLRVGSPDTVETRTDERGKFRAQILEGRTYSVWAEGERGDDGSLRVSNVAGQVIPQVPVLLKERKEAVSGRTVRLEGLEKWEGYKPLRFRLVDAAGPRVLSLQVGDGGECKLPPVIGVRATLEVLATGPHGDIRVAEVTMLWDSKKEITVPRPATVRFAIWDINTEKPVEGARIYPKHADSGTLLGVTDKNGLAEVVIPNKNRRSYGRFFVVAPGRAVAPCQHGESKNTEFKKAHKGKKVNYHAHMGEGHKLKGRVLFAPDKPASHLTLVVQGSAMHYTKKNSRSLAGCDRVFRTDSEGRFELSSLLREYPPNLVMLLEPQHLAGLPATWHQGLSPVAFAPVNLSELMDKAKEGATDILLPDFCPVELVVRTPMGTPAVRAQIKLTALNKSIGTRGDHPPLLTDRRGRIRLLLPAASKLGLTIDTGESYLLTCLETHAVAGDQSIARLEVKLPTPITIRGRVVDSENKGVGGVSLSIYPQWDGKVPHLQAEVDDDTASLPGDRNGVRLTSFGQVRDPHGLFHSMIRRRRGKTGKDGRFTLAIPRLSMRYQINASIRLDGAYRRTKAQVHVDPKAGAAEVELVLR